MRSIKEMDKRLDEREQEIESLQQEIKELNDSVIWWTNRFNAVERDNRELKQEIERLNNIIKEAREYITGHKPTDIGICGNEKKYYYTLGEDSVDYILEILGSGKE